MHIGLLTDTFARETRFGLSRYSHEIHGSLSAAGVRTTPMSAVSAYGDEEPDWLRATGFRRLPIDRKLLAGTWSLVPWPPIERWAPDVDLVHALDTDYPLATNKPWVITFHDLGVLTHPAWFGKARPWLLKRCVAAAVDRAAAIICVSQATADEFLGITGGRGAERVRVIHEGVGEEFFLPATAADIAALPATVTDTPFFLFTGSISPRKNLLRVLEAFAEVADRIPHRLVMTGAPGWDASPEMAAVSQGPLRDRIVNLGYVSDAALKALYGRASAFVYPSLYEGFGLPVLEAMAAGCPVITSNQAPLTEVAGDAALLVDPTNVRDIAQAMLSAATDEAQMKALRAAGVDQARRFSWAECGRRTREVYAEILGA
ncbi:glycosyltransferase family 4 protein [Brevundimonas vitis]|uniref:Glycosyltransferase family 4 protein n=1 Tax=Brevundimonas vitisensis TaxID=2800818 RepID=A0ABX7BKX8_9CAUL|nr:glycosyltransferase family 1 protein [Brevundimonas vitisensis]QQQ18218.1 glycosyltransferase family 4 protein [Brevundimonas vitisensis]